MVHQRNLPHIYVERAIFFITFRLKNSIPLEVLEKMKAEKEMKMLEIMQNKNLSESQKKEALYVEEKRFFGKYDQALHKYAHADDFLRKTEIAQIVADKMHEYDKERYDLIAYCIMSNHVHLLFNTDGYEKYVVSDTMQLIKGGSGFLCNRVLGREGAFWQQESYDHYVRNQKELTNIEYYVVENPVKASLVNDWQDWKFTYWHAKS